MALDKTSMATKIQIALKAVTLIQTDGVMTPTEKDTEQLKYLEAFCDGIIDEITTNGVITTTSGAPNSEHTGIIS